MPPFKANYMKTHTSSYSYVNFKITAIAFFYLFIFIEVKLLYISIKRIFKGLKIKTLVAVS